MADTASAAREKLKQVSLIYIEFACPKLQICAGVRKTRALQTKYSAVCALNYMAISILLNQCQGQFLQTLIQAVVIAVPSHLRGPDPDEVAPLLSSWASSGSQYIREHSQLPYGGSKGVQPPQCSLLAPLPRSRFAHL